MTETQINRLSNMIKDMQKQSTLYNPTTFWIGTPKMLVDELYSNEIKNFRRYNSSINLFWSCIRVFRPYARSNCTNSSYNTWCKSYRKHFILDKSIGGADADFSLDRQEFANMIQAVRDAEKLIGRVDYGMSEKRKKNRQFSRSLYVAKDIKKVRFLLKRILEV